MMLSTNMHTQKSHGITLKHMCASLLLLKQRMISHAQQRSIRKYNIKVHNVRLKTQNLLINTTVLARYRDRNELQIAEELLINAVRLSLNVQHNFSGRTLKLF